MYIKYKAYRKNSSCKTARILAVLLAVLLVMNQSMLVFAAEENEAGGEEPPTTALQEEPEETTNAEEADATDDHDTDERLTDRTGNDGSAEEPEEDKKPEAGKDDVRSALQNTDQGKESSDLQLTAEDEPEEEMITVRVSVANDTYHVSEGAPWDGVLFETEVTVPASYSMMEALHQACVDNNIETIGTTGSYVSMIGGLKEFDGGSGGGWMGTLNDWFVDHGFDQMSIKDGDVIQVVYTCALGEDLGGSFTNRDKRIKDIQTNIGELSPEFDKDHNLYNLMVPEGTEELSIYTTAVNKNYLVRSIVNDKEYERGAKIPVHDGTKIKVVCGDPAWPTMNSYEQQDTTPGKTYTITVLEGAYEFDAEGNGVNCEILFDTGENWGAYEYGKTVSVNIDYDKEKYQVIEDTVRVYVGGSSKYIVPDKVKDGVYSFRMPGEWVEFRAECETRKDYPLTVSSDLKGCSILLDHADGKYFRDETVTFTLEAESGNRINDLTVRAVEVKTGSEIELDHISQDRYGFRMPGEDVTIYAESEEKTKNGLKGYTITTAYGNVSGKLTDASRTSICELPERATSFDLSLVLDNNEVLFAVKVSNIFGDVTTYTESEIKDVSVGTRNIALLGNDVTVTVITRDETSKTHTYTIRIKTKKCELSDITPDSLIIPYEDNGSTLPYTRTLMTSGVQLYEVDYQTKVKDFKAQTANIKLAIFPDYEEEEGTLEIRCKYSEFCYVGDPSGDISDARGYYQSNISIPVKPGVTLEVPVEIDYKKASGEVLTKKYLYRITNARYTKQHFTVLSAKGNPMAPTSFTLDETGIRVIDLVFEDGTIVFDVAPGEHTVSSMKQTVNFSVTDDLKRPIESETVVIPTDIPEYNVTLSCPDSSALFTVKEMSIGLEYYVKTDKKRLTLPPGRYQVKAVNESEHTYSRTEFTVTQKDVNVSVSRPMFFDPEYVVQELNLLEEIQTYDIGNGELRIFVPEYQTRHISITPLTTGEGDDVTIGFKPYSSDTNIIVYYVKRAKTDKTTYVRYKVYNEGDIQGGTFYTDDMEMYIPAYTGADDEVPEPPDVTMLALKFGIEDRSAILSDPSYSTFMSQIERCPANIPISESNFGVSAKSFWNAGYEIHYTMRYAETENDEMQNVYIVKVLAGFVYKLGNDHECEVFDKQIFDESYMNLSPDISLTGDPNDEVSGWYQVTAWFEDSEGHRSLSDTITVYKDSRPPKGSVTISSMKGVYNKSQSSPEYTNEPVVITVNAFDEGIGLHEKPYSYDRGKTWTSDNTLTLTESTKLDCNDVWVRDALGNTVYFYGHSFDFTMYGINDTVTAYTNNWYTATWFPWETGGLSIYQPQNSSYKPYLYYYIDLENPWVSVNTSFDDRTKEMTLKVIATDDISGLETEAYSFDGGDTWQNSNVYKTTLGEYRGDQIKVRDKAGNVTTYDKNHVWTEDSFNGTGPTINSVKVVYSDSKGKGSDGRVWYDSAKIIIDASAGEYEIDGYSFNGSTYQKAEEKTFTDSIYIESGIISVADKNGNVTTYDLSVDLTNLDSTPPVILSSDIGSANNPTREIYAHISGNDSESGNIKYAISPVPMNQVERYSDDKLDLEWVTSGEFALSETIKKYGNTWLADSYDYLKWGRPINYFLGDNRMGMAVRLWIKDAVGNVSYVDLTTNGGLYLDYSGPDITEVTTEYKYFDSTSGIVKVYVAATEPKYGSGLAAKAYSFDGGKTWQASNMTTIPIGASIPAGQIMVRDKFGNISVYNKIVKTTLQDVITRIKNLDPRKAKDKDYKDILDLFNQLSDREKSKVYNWQDFLDMLGNRKDQNWDDDYGDIGEPDDGGEQGGDDPVNPDDPDDGEEGSGDEGGDSDKGAGSDDGVPSDGNGSGNNGGTPESDNADGGTDRETVSVALSNSSTSSVPDVKANAGQNFREAEIDKVGGGLLSQGMVKLWELILLIIIIVGAYTYGAQKRYRRYRDDAA